MSDAGRPSNGHAWGGPPQGVRDPQELSTAELKRRADVETVSGSQAHPADLAPS